MTIVEHKLLGDLFLMTLISFFGIALPGYALVRLIWPESDWNLGGSISTSAIQPFDIIIVGGYMLIFVLNWKFLIASLAKASLTTPTAATVLGGGLFLLLLSAFIPMVLYRRVNLIEFFGLRWLGWKHVFWIAPAFVIGMAILGAIMIQLGWQDWVKSHYGGGSQRLVQLMQNTPDIGLLAAIAFTAIVIAPIAEEFLFRGYLYPVVKRYSERWFAILFTSLLFGIIHFNLMSLPLLVILAVVLVVLYEITGSIWVPIACHAAFNATSVGFTLLGRLSETPIPIPTP